MPVAKISDQPYNSNIADQAAATADSAVKSTQRAANSALDSIASGVQTLRNQAAPAIDRAGEQVSAFAHRSADRVRETQQQLRERAMRASDTTVSYIRDEPVKAMLIAAAAGAVLMALMSLMGSSRHHDRDH